MAEYNDLDLERGGSGWACHGGGVWIGTGGGVVNAGIIFFFKGEIG